MISDLDTLECVTMLAINKKQGANAVSLTVNNWLLGLIVLHSQNLNTYGFYIYEEI